MNICISALTLMSFSLGMEKNTVRSK